MLFTDKNMRQLAAPYLRDGEKLQHCVLGGAQTHHGLTASQRVFAVTDQRILVLSKSEVIGELTRDTKLIPPKAGRFDTASEGGLAGLLNFRREFTYTNGVHEKVGFGKAAFGALLAADGRAGENQTLTRMRILH